MVEFSGKIENEIESEIINKRGQFAGILSLITGFVGLIIYLILWLIFRYSKGETIKILICVGVLVLVSGILCLPTKRLPFIWDFHIKFEDKTITVVFNHQNGAVKNYKMSKIKKVVDYGKYYYCFVSRIDPSNGIVCQKDLLISGTLEEFEKLFEGKIKRKIK